MARALQLRGVRKRFCAGAGACFASADVLRGIDLDLDVGRSLAVVGPAGCGKSTLLLCAAGLLKTEDGVIEWFGERSTAVAASRVRYYYMLSDLLTGTAPNEPQLQLLDLHESFGAVGSLSAWVGDRCDRGDAVLVVARDERLVHHAVDCVLTLSGGVLRFSRPAHSRVAEQRAS